MHSDTTCYRDGSGCRWRMNGRRERDHEGLHKAGHGNGGEEEVCETSLRE